MRASAPGAPHLAQLLSSQTRLAMSRCWPTRAGQHDYLVLAEALPCLYRERFTAFSRWFQACRRAIM
jgi:hypothetical protein